MPTKQVIATTNAPSAIGAYSQAVRHGDVVYISGQIALSPVSQEVVSSDPTEQIVQVFRNVQAVAEAAGGCLDDILKLTVYLVDLNHFPIVNEVMGTFFKPLIRHVQRSVLPHFPRVFLSKLTPSWA